MKILVSLLTFLCLSLFTYAQTINYQLVKSEKTSSSTVKLTLMVYSKSKKTIDADAQDAIGGTVYSSASFPFKGSAIKKEAAIKNAVLSINYGRVQSVFSEAKEKILSYSSRNQNHYHPFGRGDEDGVYG